MCDFLSWIETPEKNYYITGNQLNTTRGKMLQAECGSTDDTVGHGFIRLYYGLANNFGVNKECTDFSKPKNFPDEIAQAIKDGKFRGLAIVPKLLTKKALAEYKKVWQPAYAELKKIRQPAYAELKKIRKSAYAECEKVWQPAYAEYEKIRQPAYTECEKIRKSAYAECEKVWQSAYAEYEKIRQSAYAECEKIRQLAFWDLFSDINNRTKAWR